MRAHNEDNGIWSFFVHLNLWTFLGHCLQVANDVTYGLQKELVRLLFVTLAGALLTELRSALLTPKPPAQPPSNLAEWQRAQLIAREELQRGRRARHCLAAVLGLWLAGWSASALVPRLPPPLPPPPPPPPPWLAVVGHAGASRAAGVVRYCRSHWVEIVLAAGSLLLADFLNVFVTMCFALSV